MRAAASTASRVLPTPPGPVSVTRRCAVSSLVTSAMAVARPMRLVERDREVAVNGPRAGRGELRVVTQDRQVELGQLGARVDAQFLDQLIAELPIARQRLALPSGPVQGAHVGGAQALPKRVQRHEFA